MRNAFELTPVVFALRLNAAIFAHCSAVKYGIFKRKSQIPRIKKAYRRLFCAGASSMTQPLVYATGSSSSSFSFF